MFVSEEVEAMLEEIASKSDRDVRLSDVRLALMKESRDYWAAEAIATGDALGHLARRIATAEGLEEYSEAWVDRVLALEKEARKATAPKAEVLVRF